jgi:glucosamine-6-phosphate deaminase
MTINFTNVEKSFFEHAKIQQISTKVPFITVESFPQLGLLSALSFVEWVSENPNGVVSLPNGKTAQYFIHFTHFILDNWDNKKGKALLEKYNLKDIKKPDFRNLHFVQMGAFYPMKSEQHNSLYNFAKINYIDGFGIDERNSLMIRSEDIKLVDDMHFLEVFPDYVIDLSLRFREAKTAHEKIQQESIFLIDNWCTKYEEKIRQKGGIGFFLGGIGPDGHIAFNTQGTDHFSSTRLTQTNFETQAVLATDLGGIEVSRKRLVITIGLGTITHNPKAKVVVYAAGEAIADTIKTALESNPTVIAPATAFQKLENSRFYLTDGAAVKLDDSIDNFYKNGPWTHQKTERAVMDLCKKITKYGPKLDLEDLKADKYCKLIPKLNENTVQTVIDSILAKLHKGMEKEVNQIYYHTGPHHDDIMLGIMPSTNRQSRDASNELHFSVLTSGFTAVTNRFLLDLLIDTKDLINGGRIQMINYPDFFKDGYKYKWDKDIYHYLDNIAAQNNDEKRRGVCHRAIRAMVSIWGIKSKDGLRDVIYEIIAALNNSYDGGKNPAKIQKLKGMIREFEEELVWAHYGIMVKNVHHLRLSFYQSTSTTGQPDFEGDVLPILEDFRKYKPTVISLAMDPQGSGPDTHYKVLQAIARAVEAWSKEEDLSKLRIVGYRNVWFKYNPWDVEVIVPVSLNSLATLEKSFSECYVTQVNASFPSYQLDGKFSELTQRVWYDQHKQIELLLGKDFFYQNESPLLRATHGMVFHRDLNVGQFLEEAFKLEKSVVGME